MYGTGEVPVRQYGTIPWYFINEYEPYWCRTVITTRIVLEWPFDGTTVRFGRGRSVRYGSKDQEGSVRFGVRYGRPMTTFTNSGN